MAASPNREEYEELQRASDNYKPDITGPLVSERRSTKLIAEEYAKGDPIYRIKTSAIVDTHNAFRTCRGDGNCGWRAMAFGYFESLISFGDPEKCLAEAKRMEALNALLSTMGFEGVYEEFAECTIDLLQRLGTLVNEQDKAKILMDALNDESTSSYIIYHFRLLASASMRTDPGEFQDFLDIPVEVYCKTEIELPHHELDQPGIRALVDVVYKDAGFGLEIIYLDRSPGTEANTHTHRLPNIKDDLNPPIEYPIVTLLYRPGHYDIIYKSA